MFERNSCVPLSSFVQAERLARIERRLVIKACMRGTMRRFAEWVRVLGVSSIWLARDLVACSMSARPAIASIGLRSRARGGRDLGPQSTAAAASRDHAHAGAGRQAALQLALIVGAGLRLGPDRQHDLGGQNRAGRRQ